MFKEEEYHQIAVAQYLKLMHPDVLFTISPITKLSIGQGTRMKAMGYKAGTPDMMIFRPNSKYRGLFLELKRPKGTVSKEQKEFLANLLEEGYYAQVCYGSEQAIKVIKEYMRDK